MKWRPSDFGGAGSLLRNSLALMSGTVFSQGIVFLLSPLLSRQFSVSDFGNLASFNAWASFLALLGMLRYDHAIIVAKDRDTAHGAVVLSAALSAATAVICTVAIMLVSIWRPATGLDGFGTAIRFIPAGALLLALTSLVTQLTVRAGRFRWLAIVNVAQMIVTVVVQITLGIAGVRHGLIIGMLVGTVCAATMLAWQLFKEHVFDGLRNAMTFSRVWATARELSNFPRYTLAADALTVIVQQFTPVFILTLFGPVLAGLYAFAMRIVRVPLLVVSTAIGSVLRKEGMDRLRANGTLRPLYGTIVRGLLLLGLAPFAVALTFGGPVFAFVFGAQWAEAGRVIQILSPGILLEFVAFPLQAFFLITSTQRYTFRLQSIGFVCLIAALVIGKLYFNGFFATCVLISAVMVGVNLTTIVLASRVARVRHADSVAPEPAMSPT